MPPIDPQWIANLPQDLQRWGPDIGLLFRYGYEPARAIIARFLERYKNDAPGTIERGFKNGADASRRLAEKVDELIRSGRITEEQARERFEEPDFAKALQDLLLAASETPDEFSHQTLANIVTQMLTSSAVSRRTIMARMAADTLKHLNARQIKTLGLALKLLYIGPDADEGRQLREISKVREYISRVEAALKPYLDLDLEFDYIDINHLYEVGAATYFMKEYKSRLLAPIEFLAQSLSPEDNGNPTLIRARKWMRRSRTDPNRAEPFYGVANVRLTPIGYIVGECADSILFGRPFELAAEWDDPTTF